MRFRLLGPLEVTSGDQVLDVGGAKPRTLLTILLVNAGVVVPVDRLVEALWGRRPPRSAVYSLASYASRLRTSVWAEDGRRHLQYLAPGYILRIGDGELDAAEFARLLAEARSRAAVHDHLRAVELFDSALGLWRGDPLAEFTDVVDLRDEASRLRGLRSIAAEDRAASQQILGRHAETLPELERMVADHPLRERPVVLLMQAFAACGRRADALAAFTALRRRLIAELGVEPSAPAQQAQHQVLADPPAGARGDSSAPTNLPRIATTLVGRDAETSRLVARLRESALVTLTGPGGVGKTRLAIEVAYTCRTLFPDGVWLCELAPLADDGPVASAVAATLRVQQRAGSPVDRRLVEYLAPRRLLLVIDNCEHVVGQAAGLVETLVRSCPHVVVLATSREALRIEGEQIWPVSPLPVAAAEELFVRRARSVRPSYRPADEDRPSLTELCRRLDGLPLAIELAAARARTMSAAEMVARLDGLPVVSTRIAHPRHRSLDAAIDWSYRLLPPAEQELFARMSVFAGGADVDAVHGACADPGTTRARTAELLASLVDKSVVDAALIGSRTRFHLLETLRVFGRARAGRSGRSDSLERRHARYFAGLAVRAAAQLQGPDEQEWVDRTISEHENFRTAFEWAARHRDNSVALPLVTALTEVSQLRIGSEAGTWAERALEFTPVGSPLFVGCVGAAARGAWTRGDFTRARQIAALADGVPAGAGTGRPGHPGDVLADIQVHDGDLDAALHHHQAELRRARRADDPLHLSFRLYYLAVCHAARREPELGVALAEESVAAAIVTGNPTARAMAGYALGLALKKVDPERALREFDLAAQLAGSVQNFWWYGVSIMEAAATRAVHHPPSGSTAAFQHVLDHWDRVGDHTQQWLNLRYITRLLARLGAHEDARALHDHLVAAGQRSPLAPVPDAAARPATHRNYSGASDTRPDAAVALARASLHRLGSSSASE